MWTNSLVGHFLHQLSLVKSSRSIHRMRRVPWPKHIFTLWCFREDQSLLHRPRNPGRECGWWTNSSVDQVLHRLSLVQGSRSNQRMQTVQWPRQVFFVSVLGRTSFALQTKKLRNRMCLVDQLPCGSVLKSAISGTKFKIHSAHAESPMAKTFFYFFNVLRRFVFDS